MPFARSAGRFRSSRPLGMVASLWILLPVAAMAAILLLGGAGNDFAIIGGIVQSASLLTMLAVLLAPTAGPFGRHPLKPAALLFPMFVAALLAAELMPLPASWWASLPGRELPAQILAAAQVTSTWRSLSLDPAATISAALELLPGLALLLLGARSGSRGRHLLIGTLITVALVSTVLGALQSLAAERDWLFPYGQHSGQSPGLFVNRNHQASFLLLAIPLLACWVTAVPLLARADRASRLFIAVGGIAILAIGTIATASRAGFTLLPLTLVAAGFILRREAPNLRAFLAVMLPVAVLVAVASQSPIVHRALDRFDRTTDGRLLFWHNVNQTAAHYRPVGSGLGTFEAVYPSGEPREQLGGFYVNNAHNDYAELWLEIGAAAPLGFVVLLWLMAHGARRKLGRSAPDEHKRLAIAALTGLVLLILHSTVDYPLRMMGLMGIAGLLLGLLLGDAGQRVRPPWRAIRREPAVQVTPRQRAVAIGGNIAVATTILLLLVPIWGIALPRSASGDRATAGAALGISPWSPDLLTRAGLDALAAGQTDEATGLARRSIALAPMNPPAAGLLVSAWQTAGRPQDAGRLLAVVRRLGWREPRIQFALLEQAERARNDEAVVIHADALLRTGNYVAQVRPFLRQLEWIPAANAALARALAKDPAWRGEFLTNLADLDPQDVAMHARLLTHLAGTGVAAQPAEIDALLRYLVDHERVSEAAGYAVAFRRLDDRANLIDAGSLEPLDRTGPGHPFAWQPGTALGTTVSATPDRGIAIASARSTAGTALRRLTALSAGRHRLRGHAIEDARGAWRVYRWTLNCRGSGKLILPTETGPEQRHGDRISFDLGFTVPADCPAQDLILNLDSSNGGPAGITLRSISLEKD